MRCLSLFGARIRLANLCRRQSLKENLSPHLWVLGIFEGVPSSVSSHTKH